MELPGRYGVYAEGVADAENGDITGDTGVELERWRLPTLGGGVHGFVGWSGVTMNDELLDRRRE